jgi:outer membrane immunogenic protein
MKRQLLAGCAAAALTATPVLAQVPPPSPVFNWTGFYSGLNFGYSWGNGPVTYNEPAFSSIPAPTTLSSPSHLNGAIGGGQIGFNWQPGTAWVAGFEADIQAASEGASRNFSFPIDTEGASLAASLSSQISWFGTVRARAGWLPTPTTLVYATGGFAYGQVSVAGSFSDSSPPATGWSFHQSAINTGWTVGAGIEAKVPSAPNVTWKIEYLYLNLGSLGGSGFDSFGNPYSYNATFTDNILRIGLNVKVP